MSHNSLPKSADLEIVIVLNAVLAVVENGQPRFLCVRNPEGEMTLPYGPFDPVNHRTFEIGLRSWVRRQTRVSLGYVEQLYTFGDKGRDAPVAAISKADANARVVSVGYLALAPEPAKIAQKYAHWRSWYECFPWEDWRRGEPEILREAIIPALGDWIASAQSEDLRAARANRIAIAFGAGEVGWEEERSLERYELLYEAGLVWEAWRDRCDKPHLGQKTDQTAPAVVATAGAAMASDHRRILATAIGRLRGKLKYRPVIFELMPPVFTLLALQKTVEAIIGFELHKQNFRRSVEKGGLVQKTLAISARSAGRPAALFKASEGAMVDGAIRGLRVSRLKKNPSGLQPPGGPSQ